MSVPDEGQYKTRRAHLISYLRFYYIMCFDMCFTCLITVIT